MAPPNRPETGSVGSSEGGSSVVHRRRFLTTSIAGLAGAAAGRGVLRAATPAGPSLRTPLCRQLGIEFPIFSVGFGEAALPELASAVSRAGGCGILGASRASPDEIRRRIRLVRAVTDRPFGVNVILQALANPDATAAQRATVQARVAAAIAERVPVLVLFWGDPAPFVAEARKNGVKVLVQVGDLDEARAARAAGVDAVIAQGIEAGGHVKARTSVWEFLPAVVDAISPLPVLASGGIGDGAGIARALRLGAQAVSLGTRFVASEEAWVHRVYKERVVKSRAEDTLYTTLFDVGWPAPHRVIRNGGVKEWEAAGRPPAGKRPGEGTTIGTLKYAGSDEAQPWTRYAPGMILPTFEGNLELASMWAGESCSVVKQIRPAGDIVRELARDAAAARAAAAAK
jgi:NAD(P)H-dependent flavin oxidoreductase YrpB (nitropropane dioxygenase family)